MGLLLYLCIIISSICNIAGTVTDTNNSNLSNVTVIAYEDENVLNYGITNSNGEYSFDLKSSHDSVLIVSRCLGFIPDSSYVVLNDNKLIHNVTLKRDTVDLSEISIYAKRPVISRSGDTLKFSIDPFIFNEHETISAVINRLPGFSVDSNTGVISFNGKVVNDVLINEDDFLKNNYRLFTDNFSINTLETVQVIENYSKNKVFKEFKNEENIAVNLKLKPKLSHKENFEYGSSYLLKDKLRHNLDSDVLLFYNDLKQLSNIGAQNYHGSRRVLRSSSSSINPNFMFNDIDYVKGNRLSLDLDDRYYSNFQNRYYNSLSSVKINNNSKLLLNIILDKNKTDSEVSGTEKIITNDDVSFSRNDSLKLNNYSYSNKFDIMYELEKEDKLKITNNFSFKHNPYGYIESNKFSNKKQLYILSSKERTLINETTISYKLNDYAFNLEVGIKNFNNNDLSILKNQLSNRQMWSQIISSNQQNKYIRLGVYHKNIKTPLYIYYYDNNWEIDHLANKIPTNITYRNDVYGLRYDTQFSTDKLKINSSIMLNKTTQFSEIKYNSFVLDYITNLKYIFENVYVFSLNYSNVSNFSSPRHLIRNSFYTGMRSIASNQTSFQYERNTNLISSIYYKGFEEKFLYVKLMYSLNIAHSGYVPELDIDENRTHTTYNFKKYNSKNYYFRFNIQKFFKSINSSLNYKLTYSKNNTPFSYTNSDVFLISTTSKSNELMFKSAFDHWFNFEYGVDYSLNHSSRLTSQKFISLTNTAGFILKTNKLSSTIFNDLYYTNNYDGVYTSLTNIKFLYSWNKNVEIKYSWNNVFNNRKHLMFSSNNYYSYERNLVLLPTRMDLSISVSF